MSFNFDVQLTFNIYSPRRYHELDLLMTRRILGLSFVDLLAKEWNKIKIAAKSLYKR